MKRCATCNHLRAEHAAGAAWVIVPVPDLDGYWHHSYPCPGFVDPPPVWLRILNRLRTKTKGR